MKDVIEKLLVDDIDLPGIDAHALMSPRLYKKSYEIPHNHNKAGVLALIAPDVNDTPSLTYIIRASSHPKDKHAGQIAFPGGKVEKKDSSLMYTALRETNEEIGVNHEDVKVICALTELFVDVSNFLISPYLGYIDYLPDYILQESEVDEVITIPIQDLIQLEKSNKDIVVRDTHLKNIPYYDLQGHTLWGATAMITSEIITLLSD